MRQPTQTGLVVSIANRNNINALAGMNTVVATKVDDDVIAARDLVVPCATENYISLVDSSARSHQNLPLLPF